jgi:hypothetical protein
LELLIVVVEVVGAGTERRSVLSPKESSRDLKFDAVGRVLEGESEMRVLRELSDCNTRKNSNLHSLTDID